MQEFLLSSVHFLLVRTRCPKALPIACPKYCRLDCPLSGCLVYITIQGILTPLPLALTKHRHHRRQSLPLEGSAASSRAVSSEQGGAAFACALLLRTVAVQREFFQLAAPVSLHGMDCNMSLCIFDVSIGLAYSSLLLIQVPLFVLPLSCLRQGKKSSVAYSLPFLQFFVRTLQPFIVYTHNFTARSYDTLYFVLNHWLV